MKRQTAVLALFLASLACVDDLVTEFLVEDQPPAERETTCEGSVAKAFVPLAPLDARQLTGPLEALMAVDNEIHYSPEFYYWEAESPSSIGCLFGGTFSLEPSDAGESLTFEDCAFIHDFILTGSGSVDYGDNLVTFEVAVSGLNEGRLTYTRDANGAVHVTGEYNGEEVDFSG